MFGMKDGSSGKTGGLGRRGIVEMLSSLKNLRSRSIVVMLSRSKKIASLGGAGRFGICGRVILIGLKLKFGRVIPNHKLMCETSMRRFGILKFGI